ncbi:D-ribose pyranase [Geovibrio sp. ADMFC3]|jgi:D-ribose pyranase
MKKGQLLNSRISAVISEMGHTDTLVIADAGLPIPASTERIDLALTNGVPDFITTLLNVLSELQVEKITIAEEIIKANHTVWDMITAVIKKTEKAQGKKIETAMVSHERFKELTKSAKAVIRTGECTPYSNIILHSGVVF